MLCWRLQVLLSNAFNFLQRPADHSTLETTVFHPSAASLATLSGSYSSSTPAYICCSTPTLCTPGQDASDHQDQDHPRSQRLKCDSQITSLAYWLESWMEVLGICRVHSTSPFFNNDSPATEQHLWITENAIIISLIYLSHFPLPDSIP